jgi:DNA-binding transcriptional MerR regulator
MNKNELLSISTFAKFTGVPRSTLIYYDEEGIFSPIYRGDNGYRYYNYTQTITIKLIKILRIMNFPLPTIKEFAKSRNPEMILAAFNEADERICEKIDALNEMRKVVQVYADNITKGLAVKSGQISVQNMEARAITLGIPNDFSGEDTFYGAFARYCVDAHSHGDNLHYPVGGWWPDMETYLESPFRPARFFTTDPSGEMIQPAGQYLVGYAQSFYGENNDLPEQLRRYAKENKLTLTGPMLNIFIIDENSTINNDAFIMEASIMVGHS